MPIEDVLRPAIVGIIDRAGKIDRTGFFVTSNGYMLTCHHDIDDLLDQNESVKIVIHDGGQLRAVLERQKSSQELDVAVLKVDLQDIPHLRLGCDFEQDETWLTLGYHYPNTFIENKNSGSIDSVMRRIDNKGTNIKLNPKYEIRPGVSGSPVFHHNSNTVIGIIKSKAGDQEAFAVPIVDVLKIWPDLSNLNSAHSKIDDDIVPEDLKYMLTNDYYSSVRPQLSRLDQCYVKNANWLYANKSILSILKRLNYLLKGGSPGRFYEQHEKVSLGLIPRGWIQEDIIKNKDYHFTKKLIVSFFYYNRIKIEERGGQGTSMPLPVVLVIMNKTEAQELASGQAFSGYPIEISDDFNRLKDQCLDTDLPNWQQAYNENEDGTISWSPFSNYNGTIEDAIKDVVDNINIRRTEMIVPIFIDLKYLNDPSNREALQRLRKYLCLVIIDAISMRHPKIQREYSKTSLEAFPNTMVAKLSPVENVLDFTDHLSVLIENQHDLEFSRRKELDDDKSCTKSSDHQEFKNWLEQRFESGSINNYFFKG